MASLVYDSCLSVLLNLFQAVAPNLSSYDLVSVSIVYIVALLCLLPSHTPSSSLCFAICVKPRAAKGGTSF